MRSWIACLLILCAACSPRRDCENKPAFRIPFIKTAYASNAVHIKPVDSCSRNLGMFSGKFRFADTIVLSGKRRYLSDSDFVEYGIDSERASDGLQLAVANHAVVPGDSNRSCYPVFVFNETSSRKMLDIASGINAIHEALDSSGIWRPIEYNAKMEMLLCGTGAGAVLIRPQEFAVFYMPRYTGSYRTSLRVRLYTNEHVYLSPPFTGRINYSQFYLSKVSLPHAHFFHRSLHIINSAFFGAAPLGYQLQKD
ncbi:hypothetical protein [Polluticoccus soli]|uniref:hypothetical protein n=1 Tax=Polluticoccus soli TaxID=3034150 RepID=UPI0023E2AACF|nr:hypothetical protein [Flavipsychrobacter sp. JY13-12]